MKPDIEAAQIPSIGEEWRRTKGPLYSKRELESFEYLLGKLGFKHEMDDDVLGFRSFLRPTDQATVIVYLNSLGEEGQKDSGTVLVSIRGESRLTSVWDFLRENRMKRLGIAFQSAGEAVTETAQNVAQSAQSLASRLKTNICSFKKKAKP